MARPPRIEFEHALYHVTSRGNRREAIFLDDADRASFLQLLADVCDRFDATVLAWCLMGNHYHLVLTTRQANLSVLMRQLGGVYTQRFNRRHGKVGHVFQGRFKAILVDRDAYLLAACRYVDLNPVRAGLVAAPADWAWSSHRALTGQAEAPPWLDRIAVLGLLAADAGRQPPDAAALQLAQRRYAELVLTQRDEPLWPGALRQQVYLGDEQFVQRMQAQAEAPSAVAAAVPASTDGASHPGVSPRPAQDWLAEVAAASSDARAATLLRAQREGGLSLTAMARALGLTVSRVSQLVAQARRERQVA